LLKTRSRHFAGQQPLAVLGKHGDVPHRFVDAQADKPAEQKLLTELLYQLPLAAQRVQSVAAATRAKASPARSNIASSRGLSYRSAASTTTRIGRNG
jgi:hypothetical protein